MALNDVDCFEKPGLFMKLHRETVFLCLAAALLSATFSCSPANPLKNKNVIIVLVDTLRRDHVGAYAAEKNRKLTACMDELTVKGFSFSRALAPSSWTKPSVASLMTGLYPGRHGAIGNLKTYWNLALLDHAHETFAERMKSEGYQTAAFITNPHIVPFFQFHQGFDEFIQPAGDARELLDKAAGWIENRKSGDSFFLYLHIFDPHDPYFPPEEYRKRHAIETPVTKAPYARVGRPDGIRAWIELFDAWSLCPDKSGFEFEFDYEKYAATLDDELAEMGPDKVRSMLFLDFNGRDDPALANRIEYLTSLYRGDVDYTDDSIGAFIAELEKNGVLDDSIVVLTSDHGESFLERGCWGHGFDVHSEEVDIPLIFRVPGRDGPIAGAYNNPVSLVDVFPTVLDMLGMPCPQDLDGCTLWPIINASGLSERSERPVFSELILEEGDYVTALFSSGSKLIRTDLPEHPVKWVYFDVEKDPLEKLGMSIDEGGQAASALKIAIEELIKNRTLHLFGTGPEKEISDEMLKQMKQFGYL